MKAIILVGGFGTRLRPLTFSVPKPLVPFCNIPMVLHQIEALVKVGVKEIILAVNYQPDVMISFLKETEKKYGIHIHCSIEETPLGTAGPLALAKKLLTADKSPFFMFNSDVICEFPLADMLKFHKAHGKEGTIMVTEVKDPSKYGVVVHDPNGLIQQFVEKPQVFVSNKINAGMYLLETSVLDRIELRPTSIEREIFPKMAESLNLYCMLLPGYWMDVGQPKDYLIGNHLHLASIRKNSPSSLAHGEGIVGNVLVHPTAKVAKTAMIGPDVVIGANVVIDDAVRVKHSTLMDGVRIKQGAFVSKSIIGWQSAIGSWARVSDCCFGEDVSVSNEVYVQDTVVCPHKGVAEDVTSHKIIL